MKKIKLIICSVLLLIANVNAANYNIDSGNYYYSPSSLTINVGDTVTWTNVQGYHNVNFDINTITSTSFNNPISFISAPTGMGVMYTHVFAVSGTYEYDCSVGSHALNGMVGTIIVNGAPSNTIYDIVSNSPVHNYLKICLDTTLLDAVFSDVNQDLTLFAPSDDAFTALPPGTVAALLNDLTLLTNILKHHAVSGTTLSSSLTNNQVLTTLLGTDVTVTTANGDFYIDNALVTVADITADNGVVHVIDAVLLPVIDCAGIIDGIASVDSCGTCHESYMYAGMGTLNYVSTYADTVGVGGTFILSGSVTDQQYNDNWISNPTLCSNSIYDIVSNSADHTTLKAAIDLCGLDGVLSDPTASLTLFAPTDAAFNLLPAPTLAGLLNDIPQLTGILEHHVVSGNVMSSDLSNGQTVATLNGDVLVTINSGVFIDNAQVIDPDNLADNGVVHVIDAVLIPATTDIVDYNNLDKTYLYSINILGEKVSGNLKNQIIFNIFKDGSVEKVFNK